MEKDIGKIKKSENTDIVVRIDDFGGKRGLTIREYTTSERYTGFTKSGTRIPAEGFTEFRKLINTIAETDLLAEKSEEKKEEKQIEIKETKAEEKEQKTLEDKGKEAKPKRGRKKKAEKAEAEKETAELKEEEEKTENKKKEKETEEVEEF